ncbi:hypothetical protein [Lactococcus petauri]|uniref:Uncharacterized protein n=1 Tax=Lactococcus petauri TaxID=1940789 RepID=A0A252CF78_9LACT|nr:hypothetical protein [Lactococcus petauri]OUK05226.1 hypothetical protein BZZ03_00480 [Lactococcus petauri]
MTKIGQMNDFSNKEREQKRIDVSLKALELDSKTNPEGDPEKTKRLLNKLGDSTMQTVFEESPRINIDLIQSKQAASQIIFLKNTEWDIANPLDSGKSIKDINDKLFGFMKILSKTNRNELWVAYEQIEYAPYILTPVGEFFLLDNAVVRQILDTGIKLEFQHLIQLEGETLEVKAENEELIEKIVLATTLPQENEKYMVYVNPYVEPHFESGGWIKKLVEDDYTWDSNLRRAALHQGVYSTREDAEKALSWAMENDIIIFSKIITFTPEELLALTEGEKIFKQIAPI